MAKTKKMAFGGMSESLARQNAKQDRRDLRAAGGPGDTAAQKAMMDYQQQYKQHARGMENRQQRAADRREQQVAMPTRGAAPTVPGTQTAMVAQRGAGSIGAPAASIPPAAPVAPTPYVAPQGSAQAALRASQAAPVAPKPYVAPPGSAQAAFRASQAAAAPSGGLPNANPSGMGATGFGTQTGGAAPMVMAPPNAAKVGAFKKGGAVKAAKMGAVKMAKPKVGSASSRGDGIAQRGKTRGSLR